MKDLSNPTNRGVEKPCCKYHDKLWLIDEDFEDCGMAGMGDGYVCCKKCPELKFYEENMPTRRINILSLEVNNE